VEPLSRILEPVSVRHLDVDTPVSTPRKARDVVPRRQMPSQLVRLGSIDRDPGVIGPLVWDLHCQRIKDGEITEKPFVYLRQSYNTLSSAHYSPLLDIGLSPTISLDLRLLASSSCQLSCANRHSTWPRASYTTLNETPMPIVTKILVNCGFVSNRFNKNETTI
jgi:hypothetical protein